MFCSLDLYLLPSLHLNDYCALLGRLFFTKNRRIFEGFVSPSENCVSLRSLNHITLPVKNIFHMTDALLLIAIVVVQS